MERNEKKSGKREISKINLIFPFSFFSLSQTPVQGGKCYQLNIISLRFWSQQKQFQIFVFGCTHCTDSRNWYVPREVGPLSVSQSTAIKCAFEKWRRLQPLLCNTFFAINREMFTVVSRQILSRSEFDSLEEFVEFSLMPTQNLSFIFESGEKTGVFVLIEESWESHRITQLKYSIK